MKSNPFNGVRPDVADAVKVFMSSADDYHKTHLARLARTASLFVDMDPRGKVLEMGTSGFFPALVDMLGLPVEMSVTRHQRGGGGSYREMLVDLEYDRLPADDETFDLVLCCEVVEHMEIDPMFMLCEMNRVMKLGASLLLTTPNITSSRGLAKMRAGGEPYFYMQYHRSREYHRHNYEYSVPSLTKLLKAAGLRGDIWTEDLFEDGMPDVVE
jgi:SAM-dependent methyltransferase